MRRARPLIKMVVLVTATAVVISAISLFLNFVQRYPDLPLARIAHYAAVGGITNGVITGLSLAVPMALVTIVFFREISRPTFYRWAMVTVALLVIIARWGWILELMRPLLYSNDDQVIWSAVPLVLTMVLNILVCHIAAGRYLLDVRLQRIEAAES